LVAAHGVSAFPAAKVAALFQECRVAVIFDCDGVLVDTELLANRCFAAALNRAGLNWSVEETMRRLVGRSMQSCVGIIEAELGKALPEDFLTRLQQETFDSFRAAPVQPVAGVVAALDWLEAHSIPYCVASSGEMEKMRLTLGLTGLLPRFEGRMFSASMMSRGKPFPDLFLHAARGIAAPAAECTVIEDAVPGVQAGIAAGMRVLAYAGAAHADRAGLAAAGGTLFDSMDDLPRLLSNRGS
jgi:HAD superfamily hydrolase (TIGR01509 family)